MTSGSAAGDAGALKSAPIDVLELAMGDGARIVVRRMSRHPGVRIILSHGNGLAINGYEEFWKHLLPQAEVILFDFRNHGINPPAPPSAANNWVNFVADFERILAGIGERFGPKPAYGAFHSMSALTCLMHASRHRHGWNGLVLFEPPAVPPEGPPEHGETLDIHRDLSARTRKRRTSFQSPEQLGQSFARFLMFQRMPESARLQLAAATLRPDVDGTYSLCCPPGFEADTFDVGKIGPHWENFAKVGCPVLVVASTPEDTDMPVLPKISRLLAKDFGFGLVELSRTGHLLQLDKSRICADLTLDFVRRMEENRLSRAVR